MTTKTPISAFYCCTALLVFKLLPSPKSRIWFILLSSACLPPLPMSCSLRPPSFGLLLPRPSQFWRTPPYTLMTLNETSVSDSLADNANCLSPGISSSPVARLFLSSWSSWVLFLPSRTGQGCWEPRSTQDCLHPNCETRDYKWLQWFPEAWQC